jgi:hypothetical protein
MKSKIHGDPHNSGGPEVNQKPAGQGCNGLAGLPGYTFLQRESNLKLSMAPIRKVKTRQSRIYQERMSMDSVLRIPSSAAHGLPSIEKFPEKSAGHFHPWNSSIVGDVTTQKSNSLP